MKRRAIQGAVALGTVVLLAVPAGAPMVSPDLFVPPPPAPEPLHTPEIGVATWYGHTFHGLTTASGEPFDMYSLTAAHRRFPFGSLVRVTNLKNRRSVVVRINDRGPWIRSLAIDLSYAAAEHLGMTERGRARVALEPIAGN